MNLEQNRRIRYVRNKRNERYILSILKNIRTNENAENITIEETEIILKSIKEDFEKDKEKLFNEIINSEYQNEFFKIFKNKEKYIKKKKELYSYIINNLESFYQKKYNIKNDYSLYYCKCYTPIFVDVYKNKSFYKSLKWILIQLSSLESLYNEKTKKLYDLTNNYSKLKEIRNYESINRNYQLKQHEQIVNTTNKISQNLKILKHNTKDKINNGFFGL